MRLTHYSFSASASPKSLVVTTPLSASSRCAYLPLGQRDAARATPALAAVQHGSGVSDRRAGIAAVRRRRVRAIDEHWRPSFADKCVRSAAADGLRSPMRLDAITGRVLQQGRLIGLFRTVRRRAATTATRNQLRSVVQCVCVENALTLRAS